MFKFNFITFKNKRLIIQQKIHHKQEISTIQTRTCSQSGQILMMDQVPEPDIHARMNYPCTLEHPLEHYEPNQNVLQWWKERQIKIPMMAKLAMRIFAIPVTSAASERALNTSGRVIEERRTCLKGDTVESILFLNDYYKKKM